MAYKNLREYLELVDKQGRLKRIDGASWDMEAPTIGFMSSDVVLFDNFKGYPPGHRLIVNVAGGNNAPDNLHLDAMGMLTEATGNDLARAWKDKLLGFKPIPPKLVKSGPIMENVHEGKDVNLWEFPIPKIHERDGGRFFGTSAIQITREVGGRVNFGTFRVQVHDKERTGLQVCHGKDTDIIASEWHRQGKPCPVVVVTGVDPVLMTASGHHVAHVGGVTEYDFAGYLRNEPIEVIEGELTGLPIPAGAEIALEGEIMPGETEIEGPFGEWTGYSEPRTTYVIRVKRIYHRNDPILVQSSPARSTYPPGKKGLTARPWSGGAIWEQIERAGLRGIKGVAAYGRFLVVVSIKNSFAGHSRMAGYLATFCHASAFMGKYTIVVDEDIDPYSIGDVMWAVMMRADPQRAIEISRYCWSDRMDSAIPYAEKESEVDLPTMPVYNSRCVIDACKPFEWDPQYKSRVEWDVERMKKIAEKWGDIVNFDETKFLPTI